MGNKKNKKSRKEKLGGASSIDASGHSRGELIRESSEVAGAKSGSKRTIGVNGVRGKKKKTKSYVVDREKEEGISDDEADEVVDDDEAGEVVGGDEADEIPDNKQVLDDDAGGHVKEETARDLTVFFGEEARNDDCENEEDTGDEWTWEDENVPDPLSSDDENEEQSIPSLAYREDVDPEALLGLGNTFSAAEEFKHTLLRYTLKTRRNIKLYRSTSLKLGVKCADEDSSCPWRVYNSYEKSKQKLMIKVYMSEHECEITGHSNFLKCSTIAMLFAERLRLNPKITKHEIASEIQREYRMFVSVEACGNAKTKVMKQRKAS